MREGMTRAKSGRNRGAAAGLPVLFLVLALALTGAGSIKLKVIMDGASLKAAPEVGAASLVRIPLDTLLQADEKQGDWYKLSYETAPGTRLIGYIHALLVMPVEEPAAPVPVQAKPAPAKGAAAKPAEAADRAQFELLADLDVQIERSRSLIRQGAAGADEALGVLSPLTGRAVRIADRARQLQTTAEIFFLRGLAYAVKGDDGSARREFRNLFEVSADEASRLTKNMFDSRTVSLLKLAESDFLGLVTEYAVEIATEPAGAKVKADGRDLGPAPVAYKTSTPKVLIEIEKEGYKAVRESVDLSQPSTHKAYRLSPAFFNLSVKSTPSGAKIFFDGKDMGMVTNGELVRLPAGPHTVRLAKEFHADFQAKVNLGEAAPLGIEAVLVVSSYAAHGVWGGPGSPFFLNPSAVAVDRGDRIIVFDESPAKLKIFNRLGEVMNGSGTVALGLSDLVRPAGAAIGREGEIYVSDSESHAVFKLDPSGRVQARWGKFGAEGDGLNTPMGIAVGKDGMIYVADSGNGRVKVFSPNGELTGGIGGPGEGNGRFQAPRAVAVSAAGEILVLDAARVHKFSAKGEWLISWGRMGSAEGEFRNALGLCVDAAGSVYVADTGNHRVQKFDPAGHLICAWGSNGKESGLFDQPVAVAVDGGGIVYVADRNNQRIQMFTAGAAALGAAEPRAMGGGPTAGGLMR